MTGGWGPSGQKDAAIIFQGANVQYEDGEGERGQGMGRGQVGGSGSCGEFLVIVCGRATREGNGRDPGQNPRRQKNTRNKIFRKKRCLWFERITEFSFV